MTNLILMKDNVHVRDSSTIPNTYEPAPHEGLGGPIIVAVIVIWAEVYI